MTKWVNKADLLKRRLLSQQGNISKYAIYRTGPWVNTQFLKMTLNRTPVQIHREIHRVAVWFEAWDGSQEFPVSLFPSFAYTDSPQLLLTHREWYWKVMFCRRIMHSSFCQLAVPDALRILVSDCVLFTAEAMSCFGHMPLSVICLPKCAATKHRCTPP